MTKKNYKSAVSSIFKDVLEDAPRVETKIPKSQKPQARKSVHKNEVRLHVFIRFNLNKKLEDEIHRRKIDPKTRNSVNKRVVVEELIERYL